MKFLKCDRCGADIKPGRCSWLDEIKEEIRKRSGGRVPKEYGVHMRDADDNILPLDLCEDCRDALAEFMNGGRKDD